MGTIYSRVVKALEDILSVVSVFEVMLLSLVVEGAKRDKREPVPTRYQQITQMK